MKNLNMRPRGVILIEITPVIIGGNARDPQNKTWVTQKQHFEIVRYWNRVINERRLESRVEKESE